MHRALGVDAHAGGKGLNVARAVRQLGEPVRVIGFLGGAPRALIERSCAALEIDGRWVETREESRTCLIMVDRALGIQTVVNEPGPLLSDEEVAQLLEEIDRSTHPGDYLCLSGSAPPGAPDDLHARIVAGAQERGVRALLDATGTALRLGLESHPWAAAPNIDEAAVAFPPGGSPEEMAARLAEKVEVALLTLGVEGVVVANAGERYLLRPPLVKTVNAVASGDAFAAGFLVGTSRGLPVMEAAKLGVACGASNASRLEPGIGEEAEIEELMGQVSVAAV